MVTRPVKSPIKSRSSTSVPDSKVIVRIQLKLFQSDSISWNVCILHLNILHTKKSFQINMTELKIWLYLKKKYWVIDQPQLLEQRLDHFYIQWNLYDNSWFYSSGDLNVENIDEFTIPRNVAIAGDVVVVSRVSSKWRIHPVVPQEKICHDSRSCLLLNLICTGFSDLFILLPSLFLYLLHIYKNGKNALSFIQLQCQAQDANYAHQGDNEEKIIVEIHI